MKPGRGSPEMMQAAVQQPWTSRGLAVVRTPHVGDSLPSLDWAPRRGCNQRQVQVHKSGTLGLCAGLVALCRTRPLLPCAQASPVACCITNPIVSLSPPLPAIAPSFPHLLPNRSLRIPPAFRPWRLAATAACWRQRRATAMSSGSSSRCRQTGCSLGRWQTGRCGPSRARRADRWCPHGPQGAVRCTY